MLGVYKLLVEITRLLILISSIIYIFKNEFRIIAENKNENYRLSALETLDKESINCIICLEDINFHRHNEYIQLKCHTRYIITHNNNRHIYHIKCLTAWCTQKVHCPLCKKHILYN